MTNLEICEQQIADEVEGKISINIDFKDADSETIRLYAQADDNYFIEPLFSVAKKITKKMFLELKNTDISMKYNVFFDKYFNKI